MIKYDYEITVNGNQAKLNKDIYLFRGNKNVHYYFAVKNASFNFKGSTDLIEKTNAINAAVTVIKPNNVEVASAIAKVENGKIHLKVTEDLIDEEVEVGDFDLVFDLFDDTDGAVTIPKVIGQFHVLERPCTTPISELVATNTTNEVDQALTDYAIVTYAEPVASTNADGTFAKKTWVPKEKITTAELNRIEEGIFKNSSQIKDIANEIGKNEDGSDIELPTTDKTIKGAITELFQDVSNGKTLVANAITDKGVNTLATDTFQTMATNIGNISGNNSSNNGFLTKSIYKEVEGEQYRLVYNEDFDGTDIDRNYWIDDYMISRVEDAYESYSDVYVEDSILHIRIKKDMGIRTSSKNLAVSSIQSAQKNGLHMPDYLNHDVRPFFGIIGQEGYYECRMKVFKCGGSHTAWWTAGVQDTLNQTAEFDITEILGNNTTVLPHNLYPNKDTNCTQLTNNNTPCNVDLSTDFHTIGFLWEDGILKWFVDGEEIDSHTNINTPQYPMMFFLTAYRCQSGSYWGGSYDSSVEDVEFLVDYMKIYKKATSISDKDVTFVNQIPITIEETTNAYTLDKNTGIIKGMPSYCYLNWSDGTRTEHWVKWDRFNNSKKSILENGGQLIWNGRVHILGINVTATINVKIGTALVFENDSITIAVNDSKTITATVVPEDASITTINYAVNNDNCTITQSGMSCTITGTKSGVSTVTATIPNTNISKDIKITVKGITIVDLSQKTFSAGSIIDNWGSIEKEDTMQHSEYIELIPNKTYTITTYLLSDYPEHRGLMTNKTSDFSTHSSINVTRVSSEQVEIDDITYRKCTYKFTSPADTCYLWVNKATSIDVSLCSLSYM